MISCNFDLTIIYKIVIYKIVNKKIITINKKIMIIFMVSIDLWLWYWLIVN